MVALLALGALVLTAPADLLVYEGKEGLGKGRHIVFLAGDEEYRSEEGLPQLARILAFRHGFRCTVLFPIGKDGTIDPNARDHQPGMSILDSADLCVMLLRFRQWPDDSMRSFVSYRLAGKPILALRTSTHAFAYDADSKSEFKEYGWQSRAWPGGFGRQVLGESWVSHWGEHGKQATRGVLEASAHSHPVLRGVEDVFGDTDVYEAHPPPDAQVLMRGCVLSGMNPGDPPAAGRKKTDSGEEQDLNEPMMPIAWTRTLPREAGNPSRVLTCTMGAATDLRNEGLRRLLVNGAYWLLGLDVPDRADVNLVGDYRPSPFGFDRFRKGVRPSDLAWPLSRAGQTEPLRFDR
ncbi:MAG: hypothetical protein KIS66_07645 [Fimbriimonadaceae bacterium]|nr:hypothetical protein [Fimbriimonadaceae bacterium]